MLKQHDVHGMKMVTLVSNYKTALRYFAMCHLLVTGHGLRWFHMDAVNEPGGLVSLKSRKDLN